MQMLPRPPFKQTADGVTFAVKAIPKASRTKLIGWENNELKIHIAAVPEKGEANLELIHYLADILDIGKSKVHLLRGSTSRHKMILIEGVPLAIIQEKLSYIH